MNTKTIAEIAESYFYNLNPIAEKISCDIQGIKLAYEDLWDSLSENERKQIINEAVIHPEAVLKYALINTDSNNSLDNKSLGEKYIVDESSGASWRDEHSTPFFWRTVSQLNLHVFTMVDPTLLPLEQSAHIKVYNKNITNSVKNQRNGIGEKGHAVTDLKRMTHTVTDSPDSPNLVLGGAAAKNLKPKEGKNILQFPNLTSNGHQNLLTKLKATTVSKIQNGIKAVGGRNLTSDKKNLTDQSEIETLVQRNITSITKVQKPSPKNVSKPKLPPPPPPLIKNDDKKVNSDNGNIIKHYPSETSKTENERVMLLCDSPNRNVKTDDLMYTRNILSQQLSIDSSTSESVGLSSQSTKESGLNISGSNSCADGIPKSGFDFLDNW